MLYMVVSLSLWRNFSASKVIRTNWYCLFSLKNWHLLLQLKSAEICWKQHFEAILYMIVSFSLWSIFNCFLGYKDELILSIFTQKLAFAFAVQLSISYGSCSLLSSSLWGPQKWVPQGWIYLWKSFPDFPNLNIQFSNILFENKVSRRNTV